MLRILVTTRAGSAWFANSTMTIHWGALVGNAAAGKRSVAFETPRAQALNGAASCTTLTQTYPRTLVPPQVALQAHTTASHDQ